MVKNLPAIQETWVWSLGWEDPLEESMATHSSILAWRIPLSEEPGGLESTGWQRVGHGWATKHSTQRVSAVIPPSIRCRSSLFTKLPTFFPVVYRPLSSWAVCPLPLALFSFLQTSPVLPASCLHTCCLPFTPPLCMTGSFLTSGLSPHVIYSQRTYMITLCRYPTPVRTISSAFIFFLPLGTIWKCLIYIFISLLSMSLLEYGSITIPGSSCLPQSLVHVNR